MSKKVNKGKITKIKFSGLEDNPPISEKDKKRKYLLSIETPKSIKPVRPR
jgi:hypothetical protein